MGYREAARRRVPAIAVDDDEVQAAGVGGQRHAQRPRSAPPTATQCAGLWSHLVDDIDDTPTFLRVPRAARAASETGAPEHPAA